MHVTNINVPDECEKCKHKDWERSTESWLVCKNVSLEVMEYWMSKQEHICPGYEPLDKEGCDE